MTNRILRIAPLLIVMIAITACGTNPTSQTSSTTAAPAARVTDVPMEAIARTTAAVATPDPTTAAPVAAQRSPYAGIEQGRTPEGYNVLGSATAPVTLVMYSDFF